MKKIPLFFLLILHLSLFTPHSSLFTPTFASTQISRPPSNIHLKLPKPKSRKEAIKRIPDFVILNIILPPVIDRKKLKEELFGNYADYINELIKKKEIDIKKLTAIAVKEMKNKNFSLSELKRRLLSLMNIFHHSPNLEEIGVVTVAVSIAVLISLLSVSFLMRYD